VSDCRTCQHNAYKNSPAIADWISCSHPITLRKTPKPEAGDPLWVNAMTSDLKVAQMAAFHLEEGCPTYEAKP
jgi:hypothetical protein